MLRRCLSLLFVSNLPGRVSFIVLSLCGTILDDIWAPVEVLFRRSVALRPLMAALLSYLDGACSWNTLDADLSTNKKLQLDISTRRRVH